MWRTDSVLLEALKKSSEFIIKYTMTNDLHLEIDSKKKPEVGLQKQSQLPSEFREIGLVSQHEPERSAFFFIFF